MSRHFRAWTIDQTQLLPPAVVDYVPRLGLRLPAVDTSRIRRARKSMKSQTRRAQGACDRPHVVISACAWRRWAKVVNSDFDIAFSVACAHFSATAIRLGRRVPGSRRIACSTHTICLCNYRNNGQVIEVGRGLNQAAARIATVNRHQRASAPPSRAGAGDDGHAFSLQRRTTPCGVELVRKQRSSLPAASW